MIYAAPPGMIILLGIVQIRCEYSDLAAVFGRHDDDLSDLTRADRASCLIQQLYIVKRRWPAHGAGDRCLPAEIGRQQCGLCLAVTLAQWYACSLGKLAENFRRKHFTGSGCMLQRRHGRYAFAHQVTVDRRRRTE